MICQSCRKAGDLLAATAQADPRSLAVMWSTVQVLHNECRSGTWCDCQHKTGLRRQLDEMRNYGPVSLENFIFLRQGWQSRVSGGRELATITIDLPQELQHLHFGQTVNSRYDALVLITSAPHHRHGR